MKNIPLNTDEQWFLLRCLETAIDSQRDSLMEKGLVNLFDLNEWYESLETASLITRKLSQNPVLQFDCVAARESSEDLWRDFFENKSPLVIKFEYKEVLR